jgi:V8-like Glu-specific endopeptidase
MKNLILVTAFSLITAPALMANYTPKVIYGDDNRVEVYESNNPMFVELSLSTAAMIDKTSVKVNSDDSVVILGSSMQDRGICSYERFAAQQSGANCSGFLVGEDLLVTAGHCIESESDCKQNKWVFGYKMENESKVSNLTADHVYSCSSIISRSLDYNNQNDYALVKLDRSVSVATPLEIRRDDSLSVADNLVVIGHPTGIPTKISDGAFVAKLNSKIYFTANLDTYGGNSGSAVFNADTGVVEGILVRGKTDYVYDSENSCYMSNRLEDSDAGEEVTRITNFSDLIPQI